MDMLIRRSPDSLTYQFVVKAVPIDAANAAARSALVLADRLRELEQKLDEQSRDVRQLQDALRWLESRPPLRLYKKLSALLRGANRDDAAKPS